MPVPTIRRLAAAAALVTAVMGLAGCGGDDGAGVRELEGDCPTSGSASGSETSGSDASGSETSGSASAECQTTPSSEGSGSQ